MTDKWQQKIAQLSLDLIEMRAAKSEAILRMKEAKATTCKARNDSRDQLDRFREETQGFQQMCTALESELACAKSHIDRLSSQNFDYQAALMNRSETELELKEIIKVKDNELKMQQENAQDQLGAMQDMIAQLRQENQHLRASMVSAQHASTSQRQERELTQAQIMSLQNQLSKLRTENGILTVNWKCERSRVLAFEDEQIADVIKERDRLKIRLQKMEEFVRSSTSAKRVIEEKQSQLDSISSELKKLNSVVQVKDNVISQFDFQLSVLQGNLDESSEQIQVQNKLIEDLYRRLRDHEVNGSFEPSDSEKQEIENKSRFAVCEKDVILYEMWRKIECTRSIICSVLDGERPSLEPPPSSPAGSEERLGPEALHVSIAQLWEEVTVAAATHVGASCAMQ